MLRNKNSLTMSYYCLPPLVAVTIFIVLLSILLKGIKNGELNWWVLGPKCVQCAHQLAAHELKHGVAMSCDAGMTTRRPGCLPSWAWALASWPSLMPSTSSASTPRKCAGVLSNVLAAPSCCCSTAPAACCPPPLRCSPLLAPPMQ